MPPIQIFFFMSLLAFHLKPMRISQTSQPFCYAEKIETGHSFPID
jgi:hypothetical protein